jgi:hypothetical protein
MIRLRTLQVLLVLVGLGTVCGIYPLIGALLHLDTTDISIGDQMILAIYVTLGIFLLLAVRNPAAHRSLIAFTGWSTVAHFSVMIVQALGPKGDRSDLPPLSVLVVLGVAFILLLPPKQEKQVAGS